MKNILKNTNNRIRLIGKIKGLSAENKKVKSEYRTCSNQEHGYLTKQWRLQNAKLSVKTDIRHHLLAYALLRGAPYKTLERKCRPEGKPDASVILSIVLAHGANCNLDVVEAWLAGRDL